MNALELIAAIVTAISIWLATRQHVGYYATGIVSVVLYAWVYWQFRLYAEAGLQVVWLVLMLYGWYAWLHGGADRTELPVSRTTARGWAIVLVGGIVSTAIIAALQRRYTDNPAPLVDSSIAAWSIVAQWMTARKWLENWLFWVAINVVAVALYIHRGLWATAVLYVVLFVLGIEGYRTWRRSLASA
jgi:nicotinamide mononucleotide transporter